MNAAEFAALEAAFEAAQAAVAEAQWREQVIWEELDAARCNSEFGPGWSGYRWRCTLQAGHDGEHSNVFSRGEQPERISAWIGGSARA